MKGRPVGQSDVLTPDEMQYVINLPDQETLEGRRDYAVLLVFANTLMRKGEVCSLNTENVVDEGKKKFITYRGLKKRSLRPYWICLRISDSVYAELKRYMDMDKNRLPGDPLFKTLGKHGPYAPERITPKAIDLIIEKYIRMAGIKKRVTPHSFRSTYTTIRLPKYGVRPLQILGQWVNVNSMQPYLKVSDQRLEDAALEYSFTANGKFGQL